MVVCLSKIIAFQVLIASLVAVVEYYRASPDETVVTEHEVVRLDYTALRSEVLRRKEQVLDLFPIELVMNQLGQRLA